MATLYVTEVNEIVNAADVVPMPPVAEQTVAIGASSTQCAAAFNGSTRYVMLMADAVCSVAFGSNPVATATNMRLPADTFVPISVTPGHKLAVIQNT